MVDVFDKQKAQSLAGVDLSKKGSFDAPIEDLIRFINSRHNFFTTSSCSGRIVVYTLGETKKKGCKWLITSHEQVNVKDVTDAVTKAEEEIALKFEPFILHVQCRTLEKAQEMLSVALESGYRNSGLVIGKKKKIMLAVRSTHGLEVPLVFNQDIKVSNEYIEKLVAQANNKMEINFSQIKRFEEKFMSCFENG